SNVAMLGGPVGGCQGPHPSPPSGIAPAEVARAAPLAYHVRRASATAAAASGRWRPLPSTSRGSTRARIVLTWADGGALLAVLLWGISFPVMKALMGVMDPVTLVVVLWLVALVILGVVVRLRGAWRWPAAREL